MKYLLNVPSITKLEKRYVNDALNKGWLSADGEHTKIFEKKLSKLLTTRYGFAVQSGTAALHTALKALGVKSGDRVIVPNYTCLSNLSAVTQCGATPKGLNLLKSLSNKLQFNEPAHYVKDRPNEVKHAICSSNKARKYLDYKTSVSLNDAIDKVINYIKFKGPKKFEYNYDLEINNKYTPVTWKNKQF